MVGLRRRTSAPAVLQEPVRGDQAPALTAAAAVIQLDRGRIADLRVSDEAWQQESWRHYDICGEYSFSLVRIAHALASARVFVAELTEDGEPGTETANAKARAAGSGLFGGLTKRAEALRTLSIQMSAAGESYIVALANQGPDKADLWLVRSKAELKKDGGNVQVRKPMDIGGGWHTLVPGRDILMRVWTPHPRLSDQPDSPTRAVLPVLREIERLTMLTFSQIDSRLISAGLLLLRDSLDFPMQDQDGQRVNGGVTGLASEILRAAQAQLSGAGTAAGLVPIIATVPAGADGRASVADAFAHVKFDTPLTGELRDKLDHAIRRLALGLEMNPEDLMGMSGANHWTAWQIEESTVKLFIAPVLARLCMSLTEAYLRPALKAQGLDPGKYVLWFDTSALTVRPNRQQDALALWTEGLVSDDAVRRAGAWDDSDAPTKAELLGWRLWRLATTNPAMLGDPEVAKLLGLPGPIGGGGPNPGAAPADEAPPGAELEPRKLPNAPAGASPAQGGDALLASAAELAGACELLVVRALERANAKFLGRARHGAQFAAVPLAAAHTMAHPETLDAAYDLLDASCWTHVPLVASRHRVHPGQLADLLRGYAAHLLAHGYPHSDDLLREVMARGRGELGRGRR